MRSLKIFLIYIVLQTSPSRSQSQELSPSVPILSVDARVLEPVTSIDLKWQFSGTVQAMRRSELSFERVGRIERILVQQGDQVAAGAILAELNTDQLKAQLRKLNADLRAAEVNLLELKAGARKETLAAARAAVEEQRVQWENAQQNLARRQKLQRDRLVSQEEVEVAATSVKKWQSSTEAATQRLKELEDGTRAEKIESQEAVVAAIAAGAEALEVDLRHSVLYSPYAGTIVLRSMDEGSVTAPGKAVLTILENPKLEAHIGVPAETAKLIHPAETMEVVVRETKLMGKIRAVLQEVDDASRTQKVIISLPEKSDQFVVPGEVARMTLTRSQPAEGYWLPSAALLRGARGLWECYVIAQADATGTGIVEKRSIEVLHTDGEQVLVRGAVQPGERVIVSATHRVTVGQRVQAHAAGSRP